MELDVKQKIELLEKIEIELQRKYGRKKAHTVSSDDTDYQKTCEMWHYEFIKSANKYYNQ